MAFHPRGVLRGYVAGSLWPESTQERALASLRYSLWQLRHASVHAINGTRTDLQLVPSLRVDLHDALASVHRLLDRNVSCSDDDLLIEQLTKELLPSWSRDEWVILERERLRQLCLRGLEAICERLLSAGRVQEALAAALAAVREEPLRE